ncbi:MAG: T9SS type A sorting domain-containing protein [candidate division Zixibacteria bacterium]|nr:T9SS type A sorting domain-containing protein [candidate division Zixibacteria bacterium]
MVLSAMIRGMRSIFIISIILLLWSQASYTQAIKLTWEPNSEKDIAHYTVYRSTLSQQAKAHAVVPANETVFYDSSIAIGRTYYYKMTATDSANNTSEFSEEVMIVAIPQSDGSSDSLFTNSITLQNYPNPFNPETMVEFYLPIAGHLELIIYDMLGREVRRLVDSHVSSGYHKIRWTGISNDGSRVSSGIYFCRLKFNKYNGVIKLIVAR